jgi:hypothetical protein
MLRKLFFWTALSFSFALLIASAPSFAQMSRTKKMYQYDMGVGLALGVGTPSGITAIMPWDRRINIQGTLGFSLFTGKISITGDYLLEFPDLFASAALIVPYAGAGAVVQIGGDYNSLTNESEGDFHFGGRLPLGVYTTLAAYPIQLWAEAVPGLLVMSDFGPTLSLSVGARWLF